MYRLFPPIRHFIKYSAMTIQLIFLAFVVCLAVAMVITAFFSAAFCEFIRTCDTVASLSLLTNQTNTMSLRSIFTNFFITPQPEAVEREEKIKSMAKRIIYIERAIKYAYYPQDFTALDNMMEGFSREYKLLPGHSSQVIRLTQG